MCVADLRLWDKRDKFTVQQVVNYVVSGILIEIIYRIRGGKRLGEPVIT